MARGGPGFVRIGAVLTGFALVAACTPDTVPPATPTPAPPSTVSATLSAPPTESDIERQRRLDFEAAEAIYRSNVQEQQRQAQLGIAKSTPVLRQTSEGEYLDFALQGLRDIKESGWHTAGSLKIVGIARGGWQPERLQLTSCEDGSGIQFLDKSGDDVTPANLTRTFIQDLTLVPNGSSWKLSDIRSVQVKSFDGAPCAP